jgi:uncharacterized protein
MFQSWRWLTFLHWPYPPEEIRRLLPGQVTLDTFNGSAWVGLTPFLLTDLRAPFMHSAPWISQFPETNVRTYVRDPDGEGGVWFFTLEAAHLAAVLGARSLYRLPYRWARMNIERRGNIIEYGSTRKWAFGTAGTEIAVEVCEKMEAGDFENFLTARYRLYTVSRHRLAFAQIEHPPWPLRACRVLRLEQNLIEGSGVPSPSGEPIAHHSTEIHVRIGRLQWMAGALSA